MRNVLLLTALLALWPAGVASPGPAPGGWKGIVPLRSTRDDVERLLGAPEGECRCVYRAGDDLVRVDYAEAACKGPAPGWNVPAGVVLQFTFTPKDRPPFPGPGVDVSRFVKTSESPAETYYTDVGEGVRYAAQSGRLMYVQYIPSSGDKSLRCEGFPDYDGGLTRRRPYGLFAVRTDEGTFARLDNFAFQLANADGWNGYIIAYAGRVSRKGEAESVAGRARKYLIEMRGIPPERVVSIDGGFREEAEVELYLIPRTLPPPTPAPTLSPGEVKVVGAEARI